MPSLTASQSFQKSREQCKCFSSNYRKHEYVSGHADGYERGSYAFGGWSIWILTPSGKKEGWAESNLLPVDILRGECWWSGKRPGITLSNSSSILVDACFPDGACWVSLVVLIFFRRKQWPEQSVIFLSQRVSVITFWLREKRPQQTSTLFICKNIPTSIRTAMDRISKLITESAFWK